MKTYATIAAVSKYVVVFGAILGCLSLVTTLPISAQIRSWSTPVQLSPFWMIAAFPDITTDPTGQTHVTWSSGDDSFDTVFYMSTLDGKTWSEANDIFAFPHNPGESYVTRPVMSIGDQGGVYLGIHGVQDKQYLAQTAYDIAGISKAWRDLEMETSGYHVVPLVAEDGKVHVVYTSGVDDGMMQRALHLYYTQYDDHNATWSEPVDISTAFDLGVAKPSILLDDKNTLHAVWEAGIDGDRGYVVEPTSIRYSYSVNDGKSWQTPVRIDESLNPDIKTEGRNPAIAVDGTGRLVLVWWSTSDNQVKFRTSRDQGRSWSSSQTIPDVWGIGDSSATRQDIYTMATDSAGNVHLVMVGRRSPEQSERDILHLVWDGSSWSPPKIVATYQDDLPEWPRLSISQGNLLRLVWHLRTNQGESAQNSSFEIWYADRILNSPRIEPESLPASTFVAPQPISSFSVEPSPTPIPSKLIEVDLASAKKQRPDALIFSQSPRTENDEVLLILVALLPAMAVIGFVVLVAGLRRPKT